MPQRLPAPPPDRCRIGSAASLGSDRHGHAASFVTALHSRATQKAVAVTARDREKTRAFASRHDIPRTHSSVDELLADSSVDVVYVATPHPSHREQALSAIAAGKHVLIQKPIAMSADEASEILQAGRDADVLVAEAMWTRYLSQMDVIRQVLDRGLLGEVSLVRADFGFSVPMDPAHRLWNPELGGRALLDAGVYPVSSASFVLGPPTEVLALGSLVENGVDSSANILLRTSAGAQTVLSTSLVASLPVGASIHGKSGRLDVLSPFFRPCGLRLTMGNLGSDEVETWMDETVRQSSDGLSYEAVAFAPYVSQRLTVSPVCPHDEVVSVMATLGEARRHVSWFTCRRRVNSERFRRSNSERLRAV